MSVFSEEAIVESSTYFHLCWVSINASLIRMRKQSGPSFVPWGTPQVRGRKVDVTPWYRTAWRLFVRKSAIQGTRDSRIPQVKAFFL